VWPRITVIALDLAHLQDVEAALQTDAHLAGGQIGRQAGPAPARELGSAAHRICELLNHLALDRELATLAEAVRGDVALTYRLLRYANSPAIGLRTPVEAAEQAIQVLGRRELQRWLSMQLLSAGQARLAAKGLQEVALARGRLLELLGQHRGEAEPGALFTVGMLSMIEPLLQVPLATALAPLRLSDDARAALLQRQGRWAPYLQLLDAVAQARAQAAMALGAADIVEAAAEQAWHWAAGAA
jgi:c-di-GMP phosphodiesterase